MSISESRHIVITGPESTGKTEISEYLTKSFQGLYVPEYSRKYIENLNRSYNYYDILKIAKTQLAQRYEAEKQLKEFVFYDTWLMITKIWFIEVFGHYPGWIDTKLKTIKIDLYLLCAPDIPWVPDPVRENGGERRKYLFLQYKKEIENLDIPYFIIKGQGIARNKLAEKFIIKHLGNTIVR